MNVEERVKQIIDELFWGIGVNPSKETIGRYIAEALRDQIEECANVADKTAKDFTDWNWPDKQRYVPSMAETAESIAMQIRALAEQKEEVKSNDR